MKKKQKKLATVLTEFIEDCDKTNADFYIAKAISDHIDELEEIPIKVIAYEANAPVSTVSKFCRKIGYDSYKAMITDESAYDAGRDPVTRELFTGEYSSCEEMTRAYLEVTLQELLEFEKNMQIEKIHELALKLSQCGNILLLVSNYNKNVFSLLMEMLHYHNIRYAAVNRHNAVDVLDALVQDFDLVLVSSLTGQWLDDNQARLEQYQDFLYIVTIQEKEGFKCICTEKPMHVLTSYFSSQDYLFSVFLMLDYELTKIEKSVSD